MTKNELTERFRSECDNMAALVASKNANYVGNGTAFSNFDKTEILTDHVVTREQGVYVRLVDKFSRLWSLLDGVPEQVGESFGDTCMDLAAYALLLKLMYGERLEAKRAAQAGQGTVSQNTNAALHAAMNAAEAQTGHSGSAWNKLADLLRG